jgi:hypothetical protein
MSSTPPPRIEAGDSVPPLAASHVDALPPASPGHAARVFVFLIALAAGTGVAFAAGAMSPENPARPHAVGAASPAPAPAPITIAPELDDDIEPATLEEQRQKLFGRMRRELGLTEAQMSEVEAIFAASPVLGQGNPAITRHPMSRSECRRIRLESGMESWRGDARCPSPYMVPLFDPGAGQTSKDAPVCVDQYEFPDLPCEYPVVHVRAREAALLCRAVGKRICDAHEWEGACAGALHPPEQEYAFGRPRGEQRDYHNYPRERVWSYGMAQDLTRCATTSYRTPGCPGGGYELCGSNTFPAGAFPDCMSGLGVFDMHGNAAEHMNLPLVPAEMAKNGDGGFTEMKGSWFVFATMHVHEDDCRWRAPDWHATRLMSEASHLNYHLGFRCCEDVEAAPKAP